jgi:hypothetical protein
MHCKQCAVLTLSVVLFLNGCTTSAPKPSQDATPSSASGSKTVAPAETANSPAAQVLVHFAELVSQGDIKGAAGLLAPNLQGIYSMNDYAPLRNTPRMDIVKLVDRTQDWPPDVGTRDAAVAETRVFYFVVRYKVIGITDSAFVDGQLYYHKATVTRFQDTDKWLITELSTSPTRDK